jgi:hypothetical protein
MSRLVQRDAVLCVIVNMVAEAGINEGIVAGLKTAYAGAAVDDMQESALARAVEEYHLPNKRLLAYATRNPPPQSWYDEDENLF